MIDFKKIKPEMPVVGSLNDEFATVEHLEGIECLKLKQDKTGQYHYIPFSWIVSTDGNKVKIDKSRTEAMQQWSTTP